MPRVGVLLGLLLFCVAFGLNLRDPSVEAAAGINRQINFQGKLVSPTDGTNVTNGSYTIVFSIYDVAAGGVAIWTETQTPTVTDGIFQVSLGSVTPLPGSVDFDTDNIYLGVKVGADAEMTPRIRFTAVPQAFNSEKLGGLDKTGFIQNNTSPQTASFNVTGTGVVGTSLTTPTLQSAAAAALTITGNAASTWSTSAGALTVQGFGGVNLQTPATATASTHSSAVAIRTGNATGATSNSGSISVDVGTATGTAGTITIGTANASAVSVGRAGGTLTITGNSGSTFVINGVTVSATEFNRLDGKDAALIDANDSLTSTFGTIDTGDTITGTTLNGTTGINTGAGAGTQRIDASGNLTNIGTISASGNISTNGHLTNLYDSNLTNMIRNGSVEGGTTYWAVSNGGGSDGAISAYNSDAYFGTNSLRYQRTTFGTWSYIAQSINSYLPSPYFDTNKSYTLSFYARMLSGSVTLGTSIRDGNGANVVTTCSNTNITTSWTKVSCTFTPALTGGNPLVYITAGSGAAVDMIFDGMMLTTGAQAYGYSALQADKNDNAFLTGNLNLQGAVNRTGGNLALQTTTSGDITFTTAVAAGLANVLNGNLKVGDGAPSVALNGEDAYIEGTLEVDGSARFDGGLAAGSATQFQVAATGLTSIVTGTGGPILYVKESGAGYANANGAIVADTDNPTGTANVLFQGRLAGTNVFSVRADGLITGVGLNAGSGLVQGTGGLNITGNITLGSGGGNTVALGNATGALTVTGNSGSTFVINGVTIDATEFTRLDGKDAALIDANDSLTSTFGTIDTGDTITGTTLNATTGVNTGAGAGTQRIDASGNLVNIGNITASGNINSANSRTASYTTLTGASGDWFPLFSVSDSTHGMVTVNLKTYAHSSVSFTVGQGWGLGNTGRINVLNAVVSTNAGFANITGLRILQDGTVEVRLSWSSGPTVNITAQIIGTNATPTPVASLATSVSASPAVDTITSLSSGLIRAAGNVDLQGNININGSAFVNSSRVIQGGVTWNGSAIGAVYGGTGQTTTTTGDLLVGGASNTWNKLAAVASGSCLISQGVGVAPIWGSCATGGGITGSGTNGQVTYFNGGSTVTSSGNLLFNGTTLTAHTLSVSTGGLTVAGGASIQGNTSIATTGGNTLSVGNSTGLLTFTSAAGNVFNINGLTVTDVEFNRLDGKDAALVDTNDAVSTAITGTGALNSGSITSGFGAIDTGADNITTTGALSGGNLIVGATTNQRTTISAGAGNHAIEIGRTDGTGSTPLIDFHSGATAVDYDARIIASGGTGSNGGGTLTLTAGTTSINGNFLQSGAGTFSTGTGAVSLNGPTTVASGVNARGYSTTNTTSTFNGQWTRLGTCTIVTQFHDCRSIITVAHTSDGSTAASRATVDFRVKQQNALGGVPYINLEITDTNSSIDAADFVAVTTLNDGTGTTVELYGKLDSTFQQWYFNPLINTGTVQVTWQSNQGFNPALPAGTQTTAVYYSQTVASLTSIGALTIQGNTALGNGVTDQTDITGSLATKIGADFTTAGVSNNVNFGGASFYRLDTSGAAQDITGIAAGRDGQILTLINTDAALSVTIRNNSGSSSNGNKIITGTGGDITLAVGASISLIYDNTGSAATSFWRVTAGGGGTCGTCATQALDNLTSTNINAALNATSANLALQTTTSGNITLTTATTAGLANILTGNLKVGDGVPTISLNGEDAYIEGTLEVDGAVRFDGVITLAGGMPADITTPGAATATSVTIQPGTSSGASSNGPALNLRGGDTSGTTSVTGGNVVIQAGNATGGSGTRNGGNVTIDAGTGATVNGSLNFGGTNAASINLGNATNNIQTTVNGLTLLKPTAGNDSTVAFRVQNAAGNEILTVDTSNGRLLLGKVGPGGVSGQLTFNNSSNSNTITIVSGTTASSYTLTLPTSLGAVGNCLNLLDGSGTLGFDGCGTLPVGSVMMWATATPPPGWLVLNGGTYSAATYPALFALLGTTTLPNMQDRAPVGVSGTKSVRTTGGSATSSLSIANLPAHSHTMPDHTHGINSLTKTNQVASGGAGDNGSNAVVQGAANGRFGADQTGSTLADGGGNTGNTGSGTAFSVQNPYLALYFIIKAQ